MAIRHKRTIWVLVVLFACSNPVRSQSSDASRKAADFLEHAVDKQSTRVEQQFPAAKLFQVSVYNVIPKELSTGNVDIRSVESSYYIGDTHTFIQAVEEPSGGISKSDTVLLKKSSKPEDCKRGYPSAGSQVCAEQPGAPTQEPLPVRINLLGSLPVLLNQLSNHGVSQDKPIALTFTTVSRLLQTVTPSQENTQVLSRLAAMSPTETVVSVVQNGRAGSMTLFKADSGEFLGRSFPHEALSPPGRKN